MQKYLVVPGAVLGAAFLMSIAFGQDQSISPTPQPSPVFTPVATLTPPTPTLVSTVTPTPAPISTPTPTLTPNESGTLGVPLALATPVPVPSPTPPTSVRAAVLGASDLGWSEKGAPTFTIEKAVITALQQNPDILRALQEIERTKGVVIQIRAQALPQIGPSAVYDWTDPNLKSNFSSVSGGGLSSGFAQTDVSYNIKVTGTQLIFNGTTFPAIRGTFFQRDSAYFALRNTVDQVISTVKTQFYQVVVNRELIVVQQEAVHLLESQLKDQQNRFEAGTVPLQRSASRGCALQSNPAIDRGPKHLSNLDLDTRQNARPRFQSRAGNSRTDARRWSVNLRAAQDRVARSDRARKTKSAVLKTGPRQRAEPDRASPRRDRRFLSHDQRDRRGRVAQLADQFELARHFQRLDRRRDRELAYLG
jgi:Outer membrane efflux protein